MPMLHLDGLGSAPIRAPSVPYTVGEIQAWNDSQAYQFSRAGQNVPPLVTDPKVVMLINQKAASYLLVHPEGTALYPAEGTAEWWLRENVFLALFGGLALGGWLLLSAAGSKG